LNNPNTGQRQLFDLPSVSQEFLLKLQLTSSRLEFFSKKPISTKRLGSTKLDNL
jgi:hypothetical protein